MPRRVRAPEAALPGMVYAVAVNCIRSGDGAGAGGAGGGTLAASRRQRGCLATAVELGERRLAVAGGDDRVPARLQEIAERLAQIGVVLDDEDRLLGNGRATLRTLRRRRLARRRRRSRSAKSHAVKWSKRRA